MDIKSIYEYIKFDDDLGLYDLTKPTFFYRNDIDLKEFEVLSYHEMRIELVFQDMYSLEPNNVELYKDIDIILYINNIDNPLNIKEGQILKYPSIDDLTKFRVSPESIKENKNNIKEKLVVVNKTTRKDSSRQTFKDNNYSLPPVVLNIPKEPVRIENGRFLIGGI